MLKFNLVLCALGAAFLIAPSSAEAQCGYTTFGPSQVYTSSYYTPSIAVNNGYYAPTYGYSNVNYVPQYTTGFNQTYYGGNAYYNDRRARLRRVLVLAAVTGAVIAASDGDRNRHRRRRW